ncbi:MAG: Rpn family recombination-promoting nuclease/putative transposase [Rickettsiaceae bacterium]|nr:Rpn family recombination-promoting nuclease/putative transposase [Rickettsiaceae bacterium]
MKRITHLRHDGLFRKALENEIAAREFLDVHLPSYIKDKIDLSKITLDHKDSFIEKELKKSACDVLIGVELKENTSSDDLDNKAYIYCLIEHQTKPDPIMSIRIMKYMISIWQRFLKNNPNSKLPIIYPLVFYTGKDPYNSPRNLWEMSRDAKLAKDILIKGYDLINISNIPDHIIKQRRWAGMLEIFMKHIRDKDIISLWREVEEHLPEIIKHHGGSDYIISFITYSLPKARENDIITLNNLIQNNIGQNETEEVMKSAAHKIYEDGMSEGMQRGINEGMQRGINEGIQRGKIEGKKIIALNMLKKKLPIDMIIDVTDLSIAEISALKFKK